MAKESAGLLMYRKHGGVLEYLLVHPGGPFWRNKDLGSWTIPKGELQQGEDPLTGALREVEEELGCKPIGGFIPLEPVRQKAGKTVHAWAVEIDWDPSCMRSNKFTLEWPPRSGRFQEFAEVDQAAFFDLQIARKKINPAQVALLEQLEARIAG